MAGETREFPSDKVLVLCPPPSAGLQASCVFLKIVDCCQLSHRQLKRKDGYRLLEPALVWFRSRIVDYDKDKVHFEAIRELVLGACGTCKY